MGKKVADWYHYSGAIHIHTTDSDGTKTLEEVAELGREVGLDFMMFTDHMTMGNRERGGEGFYGDTAVLIGYEHNDLDDWHHYLLFESPGVYPDKMSPAEYVAAGADDGALGILAHPDEIRDRLEEYPPYPWKDWSVDRFDGLELWNQMSEWMEKLTRFNKLAMSLSPRKSMVGPTERLLQKWDELNMSRRVVGVAGVDAHAFPIKVGPFMIEIFPYKVHFKSLRTNLILREPMSKDFEKAKKQIYDAIRECRVYNSNVRWGNADNFQFYAASGKDKAASGEEIELSPDACLHVKLSSKAAIKLIHNGTVMLETISDRLKCRIKSPGLYRVEAHKRKRGWIFSNHIRVKQTRSTT